MILNGTKITVITIDRTKFIEFKLYTYAFIRFTQGFRAVELGKSFFLICLIRCKIKIILSLPDVRYYSPEQMKPEEHERFMVWHEKMLHLNFVFDFKQETENIVGMT